MSVFSPPAKALAQIDDPAFLRVILASIAWTIVAFAAVIWAVVWGAQAVVDAHAAGGWLQWLAGLVSGLGGVVLACYLFIPVAMVIATLFVDTVAEAVERRYYPYLPIARPAPLAAQVWDALALGARVLVLQLLALVLVLLLPGLGALVGWMIAAWAIGRGLFVSVAMRRMDRRSATSLYEHLRFPVLLQGALITAGSFVPFINLAVPVLGVAAMVHVLHAGISPAR